MCADGHTLGPLLDAAVRAADASGIGLGLGGKNAQALNLTVNTQLLTLLSCCKTGDAQTKRDDMTTKVLCSANHGQSKHSRPAESCWSSPDPNLWRAVGSVASGLQQVQGLVPVLTLLATSQSHSIEGALKPTVIPPAKRV